MKRIYDSVPFNLELATCPQCGVAKPLLRIWPIDRTHKQPIKESTDKYLQWDVYECSNCHDVISVKWRISTLQGRTTNVEAIALFPAVRTASEELPADVKRFLDQAMTTLYAPDAAILTAASAIDAMLKAKGVRDGTLHNRLSNAAEKGIITQDMKAWGDHVRLEANDSRHVDGRSPVPTPEQARVCVEFAEALAELLFVLPARVRRGIQAADAAGSKEKATVQVNG